MRDISAKELKGHDILAVERFRTETRWMIEYIDFRSGDEMRKFLSDTAYQDALENQKRHRIKIKRYARVIEGHILDFKPKKHHRRH